MVKVFTGTLNFTFLRYNYGSVFNLMEHNYTKYLIMASHAYKKGLSKAIKQKDCVGFGSLVTVGVRWFNETPTASVSSQ